MGKESGREFVGIVALVFLLQEMLVVLYAAGLIGFDRWRFFENGLI